MTDVRRRRRAAARSNDNGRTPHGDFIWYELMTPDADGAKAFYDAVVGWDIGRSRRASINGYRMIGRSDGGIAGGVLPLTDEMQQHGARPTWLGYISVDDVDAAVAAIEQAGGKTLMPPFDIPNVGRIAMVADPQGAPFYVMKPIPPAGRANAAKRRLLADQPSSASAGTSCRPAIRPRRATSTASQFGWDSDEFMDMGEMGEYRFIDQDGDDASARCAGAMPGGSSRTGATTSACRRSPRRRRSPKRRAARSTWARGGADGGDHIVIGTDPQGAEFALVGGKQARRRRNA